MTTLADLEAALAQARRSLAEARHVAASLDASSRGDHAQQNADRLTLERCVGLLDEMSDEAAGIQAAVLRHLRRVDPTFRTAAEEDEEGACDRDQFA